MVHTKIIKNNDLFNPHMIVYIYIFILFIGLPYIFYKTKKPRGKVIIIRGLEGSGKSFYANKMIEKIKPESYIELDMYKYWNYTSNKRTHYIQVLKCWNNCLMDYIMYMNKGVEVIVVTNPFIKRWEYKIYTELCHKYNYEFEVYQLEAESKEQARYFQMRSGHKMPILNNNYFYKKWESDEDAIDLVVDYPELEGDSYPKLNATKKELDNELERYFDRKN